MVPFCDTFWTGTDSEKLVLLISMLLRFHSALYSERARPGRVLQFSWTVSSIKIYCVGGEGVDAGGYAVRQEIIYEYVRFSYTQ